MRRGWTRFWDNGSPFEFLGKPQSGSPSPQGEQQLELLYCAFDSAGADVPQVMRAPCTLEKARKAGRVVEITLAALND